MSTTSPIEFESAEATSERLREFAGKFSVLIDEAVRNLAAERQWTPLLFLHLPSDELALSVVPPEHFEDNDAIDFFYRTILPEVIATSGAAHAALACSVWAVSPNQHSGGRVVNNPMACEAIACTAASAHEAIGAIAFLDRKSGSNLSISHWKGGLYDVRSAAAVTGALRGHLTGQL